MKAIFTDYIKEHQASVVELLSTLTQANYQEDMALWQWMYESNPVTKSGASVGISIVEDGQVVGFNGLMPMSLQYKGESVQGAWSFDTILSPSCRGKGFGGTLAETVRGAYPVVLGLGISDIQASIMLKRGYTACEEVQQYFYTKRIKTVNDVAKVVLQQLKKLTHSMSNRDRKEKQLTVNFVKASDIPQSVDDLWLRAKSSYSSLVVRDFQYLNWKYGQHPQKNYEALLITDADGTLHGIAVLLQKVERLSIVDMLCDSEDWQVMHLMMTSIMNKRTDSSKLECTTSGENLKKVLQSIGFLKYKMQPRFYAHSNIENDQNVIDNWFVMGGDSD